MKKVILWLQREKRHKEASSSPLVASSLPQRILSRIEKALSRLGEAEKQIQGQDEQLPGQEEQPDDSRSVSPDYSLEGEVAAYEFEKLSRRSYHAPPSYRGAKGQELWREWRLNFLALLENPPKKMAANRSSSAKRAKKSAMSRTGTTEDQQAFNDIARRTLEWLPSQALIFRLVLADIKVYKEKGKLVPAAHIALLKDEVAKGQKTIREVWDNVYVPMLKKWTKEETNAIAVAMDKMIDIHHRSVIAIKRSEALLQDSAAVAVPKAADNDR